MNASNQLDLFSFVNPVVAATKAPVIIEAKTTITSNIWAIAMAIPVMVLAALASGETGRRPKFLPIGKLSGAAALAADAYGIGMCRSLEIDDEVETTFFSPLAVAIGQSDGSEYSIEFNKVKERGL